MTVEDSSGSIGPYRIVHPVEPPGWGHAYVCVEPASGSKVILRIVDCREEDWIDARREQVIEDLHRLATFRHPGALAIRRVEQHGDAVWIISEYFDGTPLRSLIASRRTSVVDTLAVVAQVSQVLADARTQQLPEIEISAANVWVRDRRDVKVVILPAAWRLMQVPPGYVGAEAGPVDHHPEYASPEYVAWKKMDERTDVFEIGSLLYDALAGRKPFEGDSHLALRNEMESGALAPLQLSDPLERAAITGLIARALSPDPSKRFQTVAEFAAALRAAGDHIVTNAPAGDLLDPLSLRGVPERPTSADADTGQVLVNPPPAPAASVPVATLSALDENVQFTVFRPKALAPTRWYPLLVFAHLSEARRDAGPDEPDPVQEVQRQAEAILGDASSHNQQTVDSLEAVPRDGELTIVPHADGVEFNPASRTFRWTESVHREEFRLRARASATPGVVRGRVSIYLGALIVAEIALPLKIEPEGSTQTDDVARDAARPYRRIFASYSHRDRGIVDEYAEYARAIGDRYLQDVIDLRSGERWQPALEGMIQRADVFQLFWSWNALRSEYVTREWQYALALGRPSFIRPVYWDEPMPVAEGLPPSALRALHFERIRPRHVVAGIVPPMPLPAATSPPATPALPTAPPQSIRPSAPPSEIPHGEPAAPPASASPLPSPVLHKTLSSRWRILSAAAAVLLALVIAPMLYVGTRPPVDTDSPPTTAPPPPPPQPTPVPARGREVALSIHAADGSRLPTLTVQLFRDDSQVPDVVATTDESGTARLKGVPAGSYRAVIGTRERRVAETRVEVAPGPDDQRLEINLPTGVRFSRVP